MVLFRKLRNGEVCLKQIRLNQADPICLHILRRCETGGFLENFMEIASAKLQFLLVGLDCPQLSVKNILFHPVEQLEDPRVSPVSCAKGVLQKMLKKKLKISLYLQIPAKLVGIVQFVRLIKSFEQMYPYLDFINVSDFEEFQWVSRSDVLFLKLGQVEANRRRKRR